MHPEKTTFTESGLIPEIPDVGTNPFLVPATPLQAGMLDASRRHPLDGLYLQQLLIEFREELDPVAWSSAWAWLVNRHDILRTRFRPSPDGGFLQEVWPPEREVPVPIEDWTVLSREEALLRWEEFLIADRRTGFALEAGPAWRLRWFRLGASEWRCVWTSHHALLDGRSRRRLLREGLDRYDRVRKGIARGDGQRPEVPRLSFPDYARWLAARDPGSSRAFFEDLLRGFGDPTPLPMARRFSSEMVAGPKHGTRWRTLEEPASRRLVERAEEWGVRLHTLIQGAWAILLGQFSGEDDVVFGEVRACRHSGPEGTADVVGLLANTLPVRVRLPWTLSLREWLQSIRSQWLDLRPHETVPLAQIQAWGHRDAGQPLFESVVMFENLGLEEALREAGDLAPSRSLELRAATGFPLVLSAFGGRQIRMELTHDRRRIGDAEADRLVEGMIHLLRLLADGSPGVVGDLFRIPGEELIRLEAFQNPNQGEVPSDATLQRLFERQATHQPDAVALVQDEVTWTYRTLNARANRWAHRFQQLGVGSGCPVAIGLERCPEWVAVVLGVLKAGGVYLPLDPEYPLDRIRFLLQDAGATVCVTRDDTFSGIPGGSITVVRPDEWERALEEDPDRGMENPPPRGTSDDPACILYTSGSTGRPKGVTVPHRGIVRLVVDADYVDLGPERTLLQASPPTFDASSFEVWGALLTGGRCVLYPGRMPTLAGLRAQLTDHRVDTLWLTAALFNLVVDEDVGMLRGVRQLLTGGEALSVSHVRRALAALPETRLINGYGPTETTTFATTFAIPRDLPEDVESVPIGRPLARTRVCVLDRMQQPVPVGAVGELWISGPGVSPGYWNQPELTRERFLPDPGSGSPTTLRYRTGDRVRWTRDGVLEFLGRTDSQLKIRGHRVEPGELEEVLRGHAGVLDAAVAGRETVPGAGLQLVAYIVPRNPAQPPASEDLLLHCADRLPAYLCPTLCVGIPELPRTENGKVDRARLPQPTMPGRGALAPGEGTPDSLEGRLAGLFGEVLGTGPVRTHEDFFRLGGHSLLAMVLAVRVRKALGITLDAVALSQAPTPNLLAARIRSGSRVDLSSKGPDRRVSRELWHPLLRSQVSIWDIMDRYRGRQLGNFHRAFRIQGPLDPGALRAAIAALVDRHESWRTQFRRVDGRPSQRVVEGFRMEFPQTDLGTLSQEQALAEVRCRQVEDIRRPFELDREVAFRSELLRLAADDHVLLVGINHIAFDAWSHGILSRELSSAYQAFRQGKEWSPEPLPYQAVDFASWQKAHEASPETLRQIRYWREHLPEDFRWPEIPPDGVGEVSGRFDAAGATCRIPAPMVAALRRQSMTHGVTFSQTMFSLLNLTLHRMTGQTDLVVGAPLAARHRPGTEGLAGCFRIRAFVRMDLEGNPSFPEIVRRAHTTFAGAVAAQEVTLELAFPNHDTEHPHHWTQCPIDFNFRDGLDGGPSFEGLAVRILDRPSFSLYPRMSLQVVVLGEAVSLTLLGRSCSYSTATLQRILDLLLDTAARVAANPEARLKNLVS